MLKKPQAVVFWTTDEVALSYQSTSINTHGLLPDEGNTYFAVEATEAASYLWHGLSLTLLEQNSRNRAQPGYYNKHDTMIHINLLISLMHANIQ